MARTRCPVAQANQAAHAEFLKKFAAFRQQLAANPDSRSLIAIQIMRELGARLMTHIRRIDTQLRPCAQAK